jgi:Cd2+/Zn2+-exporting ATPase
MEQSGIDIASLPPAGVYVALDGRAAGCITFTDTLRPDAPSGVSALKALGLEPVMLSGDGAKAARKVGEACGIDTVHGDLLPEDKVRLLQKNKAARRTTLFVGDGINDAPALAAADVGAAMGMGTEAAIEAGIWSSCPSASERWPTSSAGRLTVAKARFNIVLRWVSGYGTGSGRLGLAGMWMAVFADVGVSIISVLNAVSVLRASARFRASS